jgi:hypothetical protein
MQRPEVNKMQGRDDRNRRRRLHRTSVCERHPERKSGNQGSPGARSKGRFEVPGNFSPVPGHGRAGGICRALDEGFSPAPEHNREGVAGDAAEEQKELFAIVESTKSDIVVSAP